MKNNQNAPWTTVDSNFAWNKRQQGKSFKSIAKKLGRTEAAVVQNVSSRNMRQKVKPFALEPTVGPAVTKSYADKLAKKNRVKYKKKVVVKKPVAAPAEKMVVNGGLMLTLSVSLAGGVLGAALYNYFL
tara:strand:+ start:129 stop:515 length:387 start_codon:yes stop_codon:yes gene_type:complete